MQNVLFTIGSPFVAATIMICCTYIEFRNGRKRGSW